MSRHHHHEPPPPACCCAACCNGCSAPCCYYPAPPPPPPQPAAASDHLLHAIAAHLLLNSVPPPPPPLQQLQPQPQPQPSPAAHHANLYPYAYQQQQQQPKPHAYPHPYPQHQPPLPPPPTYPSEQGHLLLHSLLRRVAALESTLPHCFPSPPVPLPHHNPRPRRHAAGEEAPPSPPPRRARRGSSSSRELAARTIQAHFRRFLARRSRTLRQLKELAILRSKAAALRGSLSGRRGCADPAAISEAAMGLLLHLDAIQGGDPMIREGKHAVSRELTRILEFVDKVLIKEHEEIPMGGALDADEYHEGCNGAFVTNPPVVNKKKVSFHRNGEVSDLHGEAVDGSEVDESSSSTETDEKKRTHRKKSDNGKPGLAAPMPVHMESRKIGGERR